MTATRDVVITVKNVEEAGTVTLSAQQPKVGVMLTASVTDLDNDRGSSVTWKWERTTIGTTGPTLTNSDGEEVIEGAKSATYTPTAKDDISEVPEGYGELHRRKGSGKDTAMETTANAVGKDGQPAEVRRDRDRQEVH